MKSLKESINESLLSSFFDLIKNQILHKAKSTEMKFKDKKMTMEELIKYVNKNLKEKCKKDAAQLIKDVTDIVKKSEGEFKKIAPILQKWNALNFEKKEGYNWDAFIGNDECTSYIQKLCKTLSNKYGWKDVFFDIDERSTEYEDSNEENSEEVEIYNTGFLAYILVTIADDV